MSRFRVQPKSSTMFVKVSGAIVVVGLHLAVIAAIVSAKPAVKPELELPEMVEVRFVEIADEVVDAAPNIEQPQEPVEAEIPPPEEVPYPPPEPDIVPE